MFKHNFKYSLKVLLKNKILLFWTLAFPIILGIFFNMAFSDIENNEKLEVINLAIINNDDFDKNEMFKKAIQTLSDETNEKRMFHTKYVSLEKAKEMLEDNEITGYILLEKQEATITVKQNGINETIIRYVVDEIQSNQEMIQNLVNTKIEEEAKQGNFNVNYEKLYQEVADLIEDNKTPLKNISNEKLSYTMIEYYTLIAMACLYGGTLSMFIVNYKLPNRNQVGKRIAISPIRKAKMLVASLLASFIIQLLGITLLFLFLIFVLKVDFGTNLPLILLLTVAGTLSGLSLGVAIATLLKSSENAKIGILIGITMLGCFLSGMMGITMKYIVDKNVPILNKINPASMITDGFYSLYYYDTLERFYVAVISLVIFSALMMILSIKGLRRQKYDSI